MNKRVAFFPVTFFPFISGIFSGGIFSVSGGIFSGGIFSAHPKDHTGKQTVEFYFQFLYPTTAEINPPAISCIDIVSFGSRSIRPSEHKNLNQRVAKSFP